MRSVLWCEDTAPPPLTGGLAAARVGLTLAEKRLANLLGHLVHLLGHLVYPHRLGSLAQEAQLGQEARSLGGGQHLQGGRVKLHIGIV